VSKYFEIIKMVLRQRWLWQALGLLVVSAVIWFIGPLIAIGAVEPLASPWVRLALILTLIGVLVGTLLWARRRANRSAREIEQGLSGADATGTDQLSEDLKVMQQRFAQAMTLLKQSRKGKRDFSERYLYELPWYVIIGPPGSGKTTLLANSDLEFPLEGEFGKDPVKGVGGTRNCDWSFTNEAILLDTAGRYTTQDSRRDADAGAWLGFLDLLKRNRPRRPINGVLVAVSLQDLMRQSEGERREHANAIRQRIQELNERLKVRLPVYLLITKCDLLAGFSEFFEDLGKGERAQVWGATFTLAEAATVDGAMDEVALEEFDLLLAGIASRVVARINEERALGRRALIFGFQQQLASVRAIIGEFVKLTFNPNRFQTPTLLRGIYFTSATQEGTPTDRLMGALAGRYGLDRAALPSMTGVKGRSYFINQLFSRIIFPEANLVGTDAKTEWRRRWLRRASYASILIGGIAIVLGWMLSYTRNQAAIAEVQNQATRYAEQIDKVPMGSLDFAALAPALDRLAAAAAQFPAAAPLPMALGLYQGARVAPQAQDAYQRVLTTRLLASLGERLRERLREATPPEQTADLLKAYLMLTELKRLEAPHVQAVMAADWAALYPGDPALRGRLEAHLQAMLATPFTPLPQDAGLVQAARNRLAQTPLWQTIYARIKTDAQANSRDDFQLVDLIGREGDVVFSSSLGDPQTRAIPGLFTLKGFQNDFRPASRRLLEQAAVDAWVYGVPEDQEPAHLKELAEEVSNLYASEYLEVWRKALDSLRIRPSPSFERLLEVVETAGNASSSPLRTVTDRVAAETQPAAKAGELLAAGKTAAAAGSAVEVAAQMNTRVQVIRQRVMKLQRAADQAGVETDLFGGAETSTLKRVDDYFTKLRELSVKRRDGQSDMDTLVLEIENLYQSLREIGQNGNPDSEAFARLKTQLQGEKSPSRDLLRRAKNLPNPVRAWIVSIGEGGSETVVGLARGGLDELWRAQIADYCRSAIEGRYPFARDASREVTLTDFARFFAPGQLLDTFFKTHLQALVDTTASPWRWRAVDGKGFGGTPQSLEQLERAGRIRAAFFPGGGATPGVELSITPKELDVGAVKFTLNVDGQQIEYGHGKEQPAKLAWPAPGGAGFAQLEFVDLAGRTTTVTGSPGDWAWFRLLDRARLQRPKGGDALNATFTKDGHSATIEIRANSVFNPLQLPDLEQFKCSPNL